MLDALDEPLHVPKLDLALWVLLTGISAAAVYGTLQASKTLAQSYGANVSKIENAQKALAKVAKPERSGVRPNESLIKQLKSARTNLNKQLAQLWKELYEQQARVLVWPKESGIVLNSEKPEEEISAPACKAYNERVVRNEFERIFAKLNLRRAKANSAATGDNGPFANRPADFEGLVAWDPKQREAMISRHLMTKGTPSSARVKLVQEDLWLLESLVDAVRPLNEGATDSLSAPLKQVVAIDVAQGAIAVAGQQPAAIWLPEAAEPAEPAEAKLPGNTLEPPSGDSSDEAFLNGRYLDENGQPLKAGAPQPFTEFRQVFVYLKLVIDQRRIHDLMAALASAALPVEVREVVVQAMPDDTAGAVLSGAGETEATKTSAPGAQVADSLTTAATTAWDSTVEIGGVVYLYNRPEIKKLGAGAAKSPAERTFRVPSAAAVAPAK